MAYWEEITESVIWLSQSPSAAFCQQVLTDLVLDHALARDLASVSSRFHGLTRVTALPRARDLASTLDRDLSRDQALAGFLARDLARNLGIDHTFNLGIALASASDSALALAKNLNPARCYSSPDTGLVLTTYLGSDPSLARFSISEIYLLLFLFSWRPVRMHPVYEGILLMKERSPK